MITTSPTNAAFALACAARQDIWLPASNGTETPFNSRSGLRLLYCYNPYLQKHAYLDCSSDVILTDDEAFRALGLY